jgi:hexosaminidase
LGTNPAVQIPTPELMPCPRHVRVYGAVRLPILEPAFSGVATPRIEAAVAHACDVVARLRGACVVGGVRPLVIACAGASAPLPALDDDERYRLTVSSDGAVRLEAAGEWGILRGLATLAQLPVRERGEWLLPVAEIEDEPRFPWRGVMLDPARRFLPVDALLRTLDAMAFYKLNVLHLHLSDDQGFRFPSARFPRLTEIGSAGRAYRRDELERLVAEAAARGIRVVPEIDMPGHCSSWLAAYPEWGARGDVRCDASQRFGVHEALLDPTRDEVIDAIDALLGELAAVFPDPFMHVGGDEVAPAWWNDNPDVRAYMAANGLQDAHELQAAFNRRLAALLDARGKRLVGWDEICHPRLPRSAVVQSWRGSAARDRATAGGFDCLVSAGYYLDLFYPADIHYAVDPGASPEADAAREAAMADDPRLAHVREGLRWMACFAEPADVDVPAAETPGRVLGGEACLWSELVSDAVLDVRLWSRMPAVAERLWSRRTTSVDTMYRRLEATTARLAAWGGVDLEATQLALFTSLGLNAKHVASLRPLLDVLEPVKWYARLLGQEAMLARVLGMEAHPERPYGVATPLDRVVDFLAPESRAARHFANDVDAWLADAQRVDLMAALSRTAQRWRGQRALLRELAARAPKLAELDAVAEVLEALAEIVLTCLSSHPHGLATETRRRWSEELALHAAPHDELIVAVAPAVRRLVTQCGVPAEPEAPHAS